MRHSSRAFPIVRALAALLAVVALSVGNSTLVHAATFNPPDVPTLIANIATANSNGQDNTINLTAGGTYTLTTVDNGVAGDENGLPVIASSGHTLTIVGNGATITRGSGAPNFRIFTVNSGTTLVLTCIIHKGIGQQDRRHFSPLFEPGFGRLRCGARRGVPLP